MFKKIVLLLLLTSLLLLGGRALLHHFSSDETKIRLALESACQGFTDERTDPILAFLTRDFVDDTTGSDREFIRGAAAAAFFQEKDPTTRDFPYRAEPLPDSITITVAPDKTTATLSFVVRITDTRNNTERTAWEFKVDGRMKKGDDGWQLARCTHETITGNARLR